LLPYFSFSVSPSTISPPPERTNASIASTSGTEKRGDPTPVVRSHAGSDGCAITSTSTSRKRSALSGPSTLAATAKSHSARVAAAST